MTLKTVKNSCDVPYITFGACSQITEYDDASSFGECCWHRLMPLAAPSVVDLRGLRVYHHGIQRVLEGEVSMP